MTFSLLFYGAGQLFEIGKLYPLGKANGEEALARCVFVEGDMVTFSALQRQAVPN